ncbi:MAG: ribosomal protein S18-alanine N-acetyltransferase [Alysiella sp.]|uniref:ribosomal protein S18-alanine N-acetyltransferase n=1 Tax=Alysiella sp. TaxID=1872483 RepID=UPI0026DA7567|nr:ribosomal protein S18-alanine N-acetyltransferase [Alysiella sp.]MDO4433192.1 ribosomal protein S18-alanine N-acetyltransferase [Alysiella sp.]
MFHLRPALPNDAFALVDLDKLCNPSAWSLSQFQAAIDTPQDTVLLLTQSDHSIAGFIVWQRVLDEMELHLIATAPHLRRMGLASQLMHAMFQAAYTHDVGRIFLEVRVSNIAAQGLYVQHGFQQVGTRKNYYANGEDALIFQRLFNQETPC